MAEAEPPRRLTRRRVRKRTHVLDERRNDLPLEGLVFEGGGVLGAAYVGALHELDRRGWIDGVYRFAGTSIGAVVAGLLACRASVDFLQRAVLDIDAAAMLDYSSNQDYQRRRTSGFARRLRIPLRAAAGTICDAVRFYRHSGVCRGDAYQRMCERLLQELTGNGRITFVDMAARFGTECVMVGTSLDRRAPVYFSEKTHPDMPLAVAMRISSSVPFLFAAVPYLGETYVDGGILDNYPLHIFDTTDASSGLRVANERVAGIKLLSTSEYLEEPFPRVHNVIDAAPALLDAIMQQALRVHVHPDDWRRTIRVNTGTVGAFNFGVTPEQTTALVQAGKEAVGKYVARCNL